MPNAPGTDPAVELDLEQLDYYVHKYISTWNPKTELTKLPVRSFAAKENPAHIRFQNVKDFDSDYSTMLNMTMRHTKHMVASCLRPNKEKPDQMRCCFNYTKPLQYATTC
jgi:hypothetical protein